MLNKWYMNLGLSRWTLPIWRFVMVFLEKMCEPIEGVSFKDYTQGNIDMRIFTPDEIKHPAAVVWIHGGGMVAGSARTPQDHGRCGQIARQLRIRVFSLNYRLSPENPFPLPLDDCYEAWQWIMNQAGRYGIDTTRIAIGGESGGGNIAAALVQRIRNYGGTQPLAQYLVYPCLDDRTGLDQSHYQKKYPSLNAEDVRFA